MGRADAAGVEEIQFLMVRSNVHDDAEPSPKDESVQRGGVELPAQPTSRAVVCACDDVQTDTNLVREKRMIRSSSPSTNEVPADSGNAGGQGARGRGQLAGIGAEENGNEKYD
jgi:hypothetical protein